MKRFLRLVAAFVSSVFIAGAILTVLLAGFFVAALVIAWLREGHLGDEDVQLLVRGGEVILIAGGGLWTIWWTTRRFLGAEIFGSSFTQIPSKSRKGEWFVLNLSTVAMFAIFGLFIYARTDGDGWVRLIKVSAWVLVLFSPCIFACSCTRSGISSQRGFYECIV